MSLAVAPNVQNFRRETFGPRVVQPRPMNRDFQNRFTAGLLILLTATAVVLAWINFQKEREFQIPSDGVWWVESKGALIARQLEPDGPGAKGGIKTGDQLVAVNQRD